MAGHPMKQSVITCIYAPTLRLEEIVVECMQATEAEFPDDTRFAAIDAASARLRDRCEMMGSR